MSYVFRCQICETVPSWRLLRHGDAVVTWACNGHVHEVLVDLQREQDNRRTEVTVTRFRK